MIPASFNEAEEWIFWMAYRKSIPSRVIKEGVYLGFIN